jgi:hypothetical protein
MTAFAGDNGYKIGYDGGSLQNAKAGTEMKLYIDGSNVRIVKDKTEIALIPAAAITEISYDRMSTGASGPRLESASSR